MYFELEDSVLHYYKNSQRACDILYISTMTVAYTTRYADFSFPSNHLQMFIGIFWIMIAMIKFGSNNFRFKSQKNDILWMLKIYFVPHLIIHIYTICLMIIGKISWSYFTTNVSVYVPTLVAITSLYLFGIKALKYNCIALITSWLLSITISMMIKGPIIFYYAIIQTYINPLIDMTSKGMQANYLELHDLVLSIGYIFTLYIYSNAKYKKQNIFFLLIMLFGMKRIAVLGIGLTMLFYFLIRPLNEKKRYIICIMSGWIMFLFCYLFIWLLSNGTLIYDLADKYGINLMGRNYYFSAIMDLVKFEPSFLGLGRHVIAKRLISDLDYLKVGGVHSDIIKMYAENGFIFFGIWLWYYLIHVTKSYKKYFGRNEALLYFGTIIYTFTLYLTDNSEIYFICQIFFITIPLAYAIQNKNVRMTDLYVKNEERRKNEIHFNN